MENMMSSNSHDYDETMYSISEGNRMWNIITDDKVDIFKNPYIPDDTKNIKTNEEKLHYYTQVERLIIDKYFKRDLEEFFKRETFIVMSYDNGLAGTGKYIPTVQTNVKFNKEDISKIISSWRGIQTNPLIIVPTRFPDYKLIIDVPNDCFKYYNIAMVLEILKTCTNSLITTDKDKLCEILQLCNDIKDSKVFKRYPAGTNIEFTDLMYNTITSNLPGLIIDKDRLANIFNDQNLPPKSTVSLFLEHAVEILFMSIKWGEYKDHFKNKDAHAIYSNKSGEAVKAIKVNSFDVEYNLFSSPPVLILHGTEPDQSITALSELLKLVDTKFKHSMEYKTSIYLHGENLYFKKFYCETNTRAAAQLDTTISKEKLIAMILNIDYTTTHEKIKKHINDYKEGCKKIFKHITEKRELELHDKVKQLYGKSKLR